MSITFVTGQPGGGKTYLAVDMILRKYYKWDKDEGLFQKKQDLTIISNIDGLMLDHLELDDEIDRCLRLQTEKNYLGNTLVNETMKEDFFYSLKAEKLKHFFNYDYQAGLQARYSSIIYIIDECQEYFDSKFGRNKWAREVFLFFEKHRHLGLDIYLITQAAGKIHGEIRVLAEREIRALPRSLSIAGELKYNEYIRGMKSNTVPKVLKPKKEVFGLYKSMEIKETEKISSPIRRIIIGAVIAVSLGSAVIYYKFFRSDEYLKATTGHVQKEETKAVESRFSTKTESPRNAENWVPVSWLTVGKKTQIVHPINNRLVDLNARVGMKFKLEGRTILACLTDKEYQEYKTLQAVNSKGLAPDQRVDSRNDSKLPEALDN